VFRKYSRLYEPFFNGKELNSFINPEEAVVYGSAVMKDSALAEVASLSLGVGFGEMSRSMSASSNAIRGSQSLSRAFSSHLWMINVNISS